MDLKHVLITIFIQAISCQDVTLTISQPRTTVGSLVELVCEQTGQGWESDWHRDGQLALTVTKTRQTPCGEEWYIDIPANTKVTCQENSGRFLLRFLQSTIELNNTRWHCTIDGSVNSSSVTIALTEKKKAEPKVNIFKTPSTLVDGNNISLTCNVSGDANVTDITWSQYWQDKLIRRVRAPFSSLHQFSVHGATYADEGNYTCNVTALDPHQGKIFLSGSVEILLNGSPVFKQPDDTIILVFLGQDVILFFQYLSSSTDANHTFLHNGVPQSIQSRSAAVQVTFHVNNVKLKREGFMVNFTLNNITDLQGGTYSLKTCNDFGCTTSYSIELRVSDPSTPSKMPSAINFLVPLCVSVGCVLIAAVVAGIIVAVRKRSHRKSHVNGASKSDDGNDPTPKEKTLSLVVQNDLYETSSRINDDDVADTSADEASFRGSVLVMQENELYEKSDDSKTVQVIDTADIYSEVRKT